MKVKYHRIENTALKQLENASVEQILESEATQDARCYRGSCKAKPTERLLVKRRNLAIPNKLYNIYYKGVRLNTKTPPMCYDKAIAYIGNVIMNYGYKPEMKEAN